MFEALTDRLGGVFARLRGRGALSEADVAAAMREVRVALLEADVALPVVKALVARIQMEAVGQQVIRAVAPGQQVIKIVHDKLVEMLGGQTRSLDLAGAPPVPLMMVGLQGSGKTTSTAKIALRLKDQQKKKVLMASLDTRRPAAQDQLAVLGTQIGVDTLPIIAGQAPVAIAERALKEARLGGYDVVMLDTAGRLAIDEALMAEVAAIHATARPRETLLVADAMTGQDAVAVASAFDARVALTGIVLTRIDGDARGGAALSMREVTGKPILLMGTGEKLDAMEPFHPERIAGRILGQGDVVSLVEKAAATIDQQEAEALALKMQAGAFGLSDYAQQLVQMKKMGGLGGIMGFMPGVQKIKQAMAKANFDERILDRQQAIISAMTLKERQDVKILNASRRRRIAAGSGTSVQEVNQLLKQFRQMQDMMKMMKKLGKKGLMRQGLGALLGGGMPH